MRIRVVILTATISIAQICAVGQESTPALPPGTITGSGTSGFVPKFTGTLTLANSVLFQGASGNVGIGTTKPSAKLHVNGAINATSFSLGGTPFAFGSASNNNAFLGFAANSTMTGTFNTASGVKALFSNTTGSFDTASGYEALFLNTTGVNTAYGAFALGSNTTGNDNAAVGVGALYMNTTGSQNTAIGDYALNNATADLNTAAGYSALIHNTSGYENAAVGASALASNTTGYFNTAIGKGALVSNTTGVLNTALGFLADVGDPALINATAIGAESYVTTSNSLVLGSSISSNGIANTKVGIDVFAPSNIFTILQGGGVAIADGWATYSSRRWKTNIQSLHGALGKVEQLRGVSYDLKANGQHEIGLIAEEVGTVVPELVSWDVDGKDAQGVDYGRLTALLIEATKEQQALIQEQQTQIRTQGAELETQRATIARLASQLDKVEGLIAASQRIDTDSQHHLSASRK